jgi:hypothetical protein
VAGEEWPARVWGQRPLKGFFLGRTPQLAAGFFTAAPPYSLADRTPPLVTPSRYHIVDEMSTLLRGKSQKAPLLAVGMNGKRGSGGGSPQELFPWKKPRRLRRGSLQTLPPNGGLHPCGGCGKESPLQPTPQPRVTADVRGR